MVQRQELGFLFCSLPSRHKTLHKILNFQSPTHICENELFECCLHVKKRKKEKGLESVCNVEKKKKEKIKSNSIEINKSKSNANGGKSINYANHLPSLPTMKLISDISSLLNMAAFRSRTVGLVACQFGSPVSMVNMALFGIVNDVELWAPGDVNGDDGMLDGCVTCIFSRCIWELLCGGDSNKWPLFRDSTVKRRT